MSSASLASQPTGSARTAHHQQQKSFQKMLQQQTTSSQSQLGSFTPASKSTAPITRVAIRDGKTIGINDHIYLSAAWAPGAGEPYIIARVMEFVTAQSSRSGAAALASSSGTLQVRANLFLRMRDISSRASHDPRQLVATMHSDVYSLENVRGLCEVRHRELIGDGSAPDVSRWKKMDDHFYYHQLYDRYIHRFYDVIPTEKVKNAPPEVLSVLRSRYSFIVAEVGMTADLCDALRGCAVCHRWAASVESVRCDTCKKFFHMKCLTPPLLSKPAKGYSWTCAPCSRKHEQDVGLALAGQGSFPANNGAEPSKPSGTQGVIRNSPGPAGGRGRGGSRGRGRGTLSSTRRALLSQDDGTSSDFSPDGSPNPEKGPDDIKGTRCFNRWPYRYFGQHTMAPDILDPHDSIYPRAVTRLGPKFQAVLPSWQEQKEMGLGVKAPTKTKEKEDSHDPTSATGEESAASSASTGTNRKKGRPPKRKRADDRADTPAITPSVTVAPLPEPPTPEFERGIDESVEPIFIPSKARPNTIVDIYLRTAKDLFSSIPGHNTDFLDRALMLLTRENDPSRALSALSRSTTEELRLVHWSHKELKQFDNGIKEFNAEMRQLKKAIPTKKVKDIVRHFYTWKTQRLREILQAEAEAAEVAKQKGKGAKPVVNANAPTRASTSRAVSPALSIFGDGPPAGPSTTCSMCSTSSSPFWYKGHVSWPNRALCSSCGQHWRKYAAESTNTDLLATNPRKAGSGTPATSSVSLPGHDDTGLGVAPPVKVAKISKDSTASKPLSSSSSAPSLAAAAPLLTPPPPPPPPKIDPLKCVICKKMEPKKKLAQCRQCTLSVHQGCFGLTDEDLANESWLCDACWNESSLDAALIPQCILCPPPPPPSESHSSLSAPANPPEKPGRGRPPKSQASEASKIITPPLNALDAFKPTECNNWTHLVCSVWMPEVVFSNTEKLKMVEGSGNLPLWRYEAVCSICDQSRGACISCAEPTCKKTFHISCAFTAQPSYTFGFEIQPVKGSRRDVKATLTFKGETGHMSALVWCKEHREVAKNRKIYDLSETDPTTGLTTLQTFVRANKHVLPNGAGGTSVVGTGAGAVGTAMTTTPSANGITSVSDSTYALLRRAKRLDLVLNTSFGPNPSLPRGSMGRASSILPAPLQSSARAARRLSSTAPLNALAAKSSTLYSNGHGSISSSFLDQAGGLNGSAPKTPPRFKPQKKCVNCSTTFSPFWWNVPDDDTGEEEDELAAEESTRTPPPQGVRKQSQISGGGAKSEKLCCNRCRPEILPHLDMEQ